jgi:hypothetical protein
VYVTARIATRATLFALACVAGSCGRVPPLAGTHDSARSLAQAVVAAVARADRAALQSLAVSESEYRDHVWPSLPAARPERNLPFSYVWGDTAQKSAGGLSTVLSQYGGQELTFVDVRFEGVTAYDGFRIHRDPTFDVTLASGQQSLKLSGSFVEKDGRWKVLSYLID